MPSYRRSYNSRRATSNTFSKKRRKYTNAEKIAFKLGQEKRVRDSINSGKKDTRVYTAFEKGFRGLPVNNKKKSLY